MSPTYRCVGVQVATHILDFQLQLLLCPAACTLNYHQSRLSPSYIQLIAYLEGKMLQEVCCSIGLIRLCSGTGINPHTNSGSLGPWRMLCSNLDNVNAFLSIRISIAYRQTVR